MKEIAIDLFNHNFFEYKLNITEDEIKQLEVCLQNIKPTRNYNCISTYSVINVLNMPLLKNLRNQIIEILEKKQLILRHNWAQLYKRDHYHEIHTHGEDDYSGIIYIKKDYDDEDASTFFYDIFKNALRKNPIHSFPFKEKTLLLFPGYVPHYVNPVRTEGNRIVISFNCSRLEECQKK